MPTLGSLASWAASAAHRLLVDQPARRAHVSGVAQRAAEVAWSLAIPPVPGERLVAAAYLHDIGYAPAVMGTGFHPLDGAQHVEVRTGDAELAALVAHHSCAAEEARLRGLEDELMRYPHPDPLLADALTYADMTVGPNGNDVTVHERLTDIESRYGADHIVSRAVSAASPQLIAAVRRTEERLRAAKARQRRTA